MRFWAVVLPAEVYQEQRLYDHDTVALDTAAAGEGDEVLLVAPTDPPALVGLGRVARPGVVRYTRKNLDDPPPANGLALDGPLAQPLTEAAFRAAADRLAPPRDRTPWLVSVDLPIEAESPAEAVRQFWSYVRALGPRELPAFVAPAGDELALRAYVGGELAELDPEEE